MKLLIVDDQTSVVKGLVKGIDWKNILISEVHVAYNAYEAKQILQKEQIDIMLCDIEMPVENGLQLLKWVNEKKMELECIFLTAHAEFEYARAAIKEGGFDYILQPAPYEEIEAAVKRAILIVQNKKEKKQAYSYGSILLQSENDVKEKTLRDIIYGRNSQIQYEKLQEVICIPTWEQSVYLVLMQVFNWKIQINNWDTQLIQFALNNIVSEVFAPYDQKVILTQLDKFVFVFVLYSENDYHMDFEGVCRQLVSLKKAFKEFLNSDIACYLGKEVKVCELLNQRIELENIMKQNVSMKSDIFILNENDKIDVNSKNGVKEYDLLQINRWTKYLRQNLMDTVKNEIFEYLDCLAAEGKLKKEILMRFHMDMTKMFSVIMEEFFVESHEVFKNEETFELYQNASNSISDMKELVAYMIQYLKELQFDESKEIDQIVKVQQYIQDNIEKDIKRSEIADYVHLNMDYLTRIFKREVGISLKEYIIQEKMKVGQNLIRTTMLPISFISSKIGYCNYSHFSKTYKKTFGISPTDERR